MPHTNVELSKKELMLVSSSEFILTKNRIIENVYNLFGELSEEYKSIINNHKQYLPEDIFKSSPKIAKGENYIGLPYVMLDYPRIFSKNNSFALRSFFWWGNYFSITLQLSGNYFETYKQTIQRNLQTTLADNYFVCVNENEWQHHFEETNYKPLTQENIDRSLQKPFIKIAKKLPLHEWNNASHFYATNYISLIKLLL